MDDLLIIEDEDGFRTTWPWPSRRSLIGNTDFVALCEAGHDQMKAAATPKGDGRG